ncbi:MAG: hypothetical protein UH824_01765 [Acutalibacteraceae bacterium]|nr:hypothetical protein [Acutalibacteraceae bacterium]
MKRIICMIIAVVIAMTALSLASCSVGGTNNTPTTTKAALNTLENVKKLAMQGKIDTVEYTLGTKADSIIDKYSTTAAADDTDNTAADEHINEHVFDVTEKTDYTRIILDTAQYFYNNDDANKQIGVIACTADAYNFKAGNCYSDDVIDALGKPDSKDIPAAEDLIYTFGVPQGVSRITYKFGKIRLDFVFVDDNLIATVLTDTEIYKNMGHSQTTAAATAGANATGDGDE